MDDKMIKKYLEKMEFKPFILEFTYVIGGDDYPWFDSYSESESDEEEITKKYQQVAKMFCPFCGKANETFIYKNEKNKAYSYNCNCGESYLVIGDKKMNKNKIIKKMTFENKNNNDIEKNVTINLKVFNEFGAYSKSSVDAKIWFQKTTIEEAFKILKESFLNNKNLIEYRIRAFT